ncbi:MAG: DUF3060 domain-containing protein [Alphaproteobacteria bacterium]|nr:DUF3060 domain-containing protein [Alphaproteobacteria bacterium]
MSAVILRIAAIGLLVAGCKSTTPPIAVDQNGFAVYTASQLNATIPCDTRPVQLNVSRTDLRLTGPCRFVRLTGDHNDVYVELAPGGSIEITGAHNDVTWRQLRPGPEPVLTDRGESNTFHHDEG